ncbi:MAG: preQ(1) synthase [Hyphomicrobiales bacterium]|nr:preQ(1) synthase [Hyphomicrobiales bacterium]MCY4052773.1 preQ(1) synthase [Hyphomicrobiales bacterium]
MIEFKSFNKLTEYSYDTADYELLDRFPNPNNSNGSVSIISPEFTMLCPVSGQPDFATIRVNYIPRKWCLEAKSWKLYLISYRQYGISYESCVKKIMNDLVKLLDPEYLHVKAEFAPRGGISFHPELYYGEKPQKT